MSPSVLMLVATLVSQAPAPAPTPPPNPLAGWTLSATFEGYYEWNANQPPNRVNVLRAYDTRANTFSIQQAAVVLETAPDRSASRPFGLRVDLQFGQATDTVQGSPANEPRPDVYRNLWQAYGSYVFPGAHAVRMDFGKFGSSLGFETNYAKDNINFSRALLFDFLPFYHNGLRLQVPVGDKLALSYMLTNGVQQTEDFNNFKSNQFMAVLTPIKGVTWTVNYYTGQEQPDHGRPDGPDGWFHVFDTYVTYAPTASASFAADVNHTVNQVHAGDAFGALTGFSGYARYQVTPPVAVATRYEYLNDAGGLYGGVKQVLQEITLTLEHKLADGFLVRGEFRSDWSDRAYFPAHDGTLNTRQHTWLVGLVWWMGGKSGGW
ncbi:MAG TPA: outer membrane beta-barrel protein [Vicinamibacterales bacterium]|nr:outer membrane beta-barrel protein [Vicinamibacterales bacterium]